MTNKNKIIPKQEVVPIPIIIFIICSLIILVIIVGITPPMLPKIIFGINGGIIEGIILAIMFLIFVKIFFFGGIQIKPFKIKFLLGFGISLTTLLIWKMGNIPFYYVNHNYFIPSVLTASILFSLVLINDSIFDESIFKLNERITKLENENIK